MRIKCVCFIHLQAGAGLSPTYPHRNRWRPRALAPQLPGRPKVFAGLVAARRIRMGILPRKSEVVHVKLTLDQALEQLRLQYVGARAREERLMTLAASRYKSTKDPAALEDCILLERSLDVASKLQATSSGVRFR